MTSILRLIGPLALVALTTSACGQTKPAPQPVQSYTPSSPPAAPAQSYTPSAPVAARIACTI